MCRTQRGFLAAASAGSERVIQPRPRPPGCARAPGCGDMDAQRYAIIPEPWPSIDQLWQRLAPCRWLAICRAQCDFVAASAGSELLALLSLPGCAGARQRRYGCAGSAMHSSPSHSGEAERYWRSCHLRTSNEKSWCRGLIHPDAIAAHAELALTRARLRQFARRGTNSRRNASLAPK